MSFDNSGTDIAATDIQGLGTELTDRIASLEGMVTELNSSVRECLEKEPASYQMPENECLEKQTDISKAPANWIVLDKQTRINGKVMLNLPCTLFLRYLKINITYANDMGRAHIYEIQVFGPDNPYTNLAYRLVGTTVTAISGSAAYSAIDGNFSGGWISDRDNPGWVSEEDPHWIIVDLGRNYRIDRIVIDAGNYYQDYFLLGMAGIQMSENECLEEETPADWVTLDEQTQVNETVALNLTCAMHLRYLKISATYSDDAGQVNVHEIQVFGPDTPNTNLALNKTVTAISSQGGNSGNQGPGSAVDWDFSSRWASERNDPGPASVEVPHWIMVDLGQNFRIDRIVIDLADHRLDYTLLGKRGE
ncbi:MAG: discoidin domain-containing protein [Candidatus Pacebacteria bacterium]|nr:discoidin domain-containing protein [Candidatus Paceibacterota bacterium]